MKIQDFNNIILDRVGEGRDNNTLEIIIATTAFLLPAILLFLIAAKWNFTVPNLFS